MVEQEENITSANEPNVTPDAGVRKRFQSEIEFPYADLESAVDLASALLKSGGGSGDDVEVAAWLNQTANGGTYRARRSAARMFGLVDVSLGKLVLSALGRAVSDESTARTAVADAFLKPALYAAMYEKCRGTVLPPPAAIERMMQQLGVSPKQKERARQAFQKSATFAGFVDANTGRFIKPGNTSTVPPEAPLSEKTKGGGGGGPGDPLIAALIQKLPQHGPWPSADREIWLKMAVMAFDMAYGRDEGITVTVAKRQDG